MNDLEICSDCGCAVPADIAHYGGWGKPTLMNGQGYPICLPCFDRLYNTHVADIDDDYDPELEY